MEAASSLSSRMKTVQAAITLPEDLYLPLSYFGLTRDRIISEAGKLLALRIFQGKISFSGFRELSKEGDRMPEKKTKLHYAFINTKG